MLKFRIGAPVAFRADGCGAMDGMLTRYNRESATVITDKRSRWDVARGLLRRVRWYPPQRTFRRV